MKFHANIFGVSTAGRRLVTINSTYFIWQRQKSRIKAWSHGMLTAFQVT